MLKINFDAKVWKQGNSLILTIPSDVRNTYSIKEGDIMRMSAGVIDEKQQKEEAELRRLSAKYPIYGEGAIIHKNEEVIKLNQVFCRLLEFKGGTLAPGQSFDDLPVQKVVVGIIKEGSILHIAYDKKHYDPILLHDPYFMRNLMGDEKIKIRASDGKNIIINNLRFENDILRKDRLRLNNVEFHGDLEETNG